MENKKPTTKKPEEKKPKAKNKITSYKEAVAFVSSKSLKEDTQGFGYRYLSLEKIRDNLSKWGIEYVVQIRGLSLTKLDSTNELREDVILNSKTIINKITKVKTKTGTSDRDIMFYTAKIYVEAYGEKLEYEIDVPLLFGDIKEILKAKKYLRRFALINFFNIDAGDEDVEQEEEESKPTSSSSITSTATKNKLIVKSPAKANKSQVEKLSNKELEEFLDDFN